MSSGADSYLLLRALVDELVRCGMQHACISPGSRSAPIALCLANEPRLTCHSHIDERCAGFFALGLAKASGLPVAVACTSGTAAAELLPAAIEAREARTPLLLLTADRPPELREVGAGQAIDQLKLFGGAAKWFFEVDVDSAEEARLRWIRALACRAYWTTLEGRPGVVHLNLPLREPLVTDEPLPPDPTARADGAPYVARRLQAQASPASSTHDVPVRSADAADATETPAIARLLELVGAARHGVLVAGRDERGGEGTPTAIAAARFCEAAGWPLLADPLSRARRGQAAIAHYDALLRSAAFTERMRPDLVIRIGDLPTSKPLRSWLSQMTDVPQVALDPEGAWQDPAAVLSESFALDPAAALRELGAAVVSGSQAQDWLQQWRYADERASEAIVGALGGELSEPRVAAELGVLLPAQATLFVASSMPVREIESFWPVRDDPPRVLCNRGANGIDGTVSSAFGVAAAAACAAGRETGGKSQAAGGGSAQGPEHGAARGAERATSQETGRGPVVLLIGDVALAHDIGGLLAASRLQLPLTIVLIDNGGGGIFDFLPLASTPLAREPAGAPAPSEEGAAAEDVFTRHVATPTGLDFAAAAVLYGLHHEQVSDVSSFRAALERAVSSPRSSIVEVRSEREANVALHERIWSAVAYAHSAC